MSSEEKVIIKARKVRGSRETDTAIGEVMETKQTNRPSSIFVNTQLFGEGELSSKP